MQSLALPEEFIEMTQLLFNGTSVKVKVNGSVTAEFGIHKRLWQGCSLASYIFIIVVEVLNAIVKKGVDEGMVQGINLPF